MATHSTMPPSAPGGQEGRARRGRSRHSRVEVARSIPRRNGRFVARTGPDNSLDELRELILATGEPDPTIAQVDALRLERGEPIPSVRTLIIRFGHIGWPRLRSLALAPVAERGRLESLFAATRPETSWDPELVVRGLRAVAERTGQVPSQIEYDLAVAEIHQEWIRQGVDSPPWLPCAGTILAHGPWGYMLAEAGLAEPRPEPARTPNPAPSVFDTAMACYEDTGVLVAHPHLREWARARGLRLPAQETRPPWPQVVAAVRELCEAKGIEPPTTVKRRNAPPIEPAAEPIDWNSGAAKGFAYSREQVIASLARYLERHTGPGTPPRCKHYQALCAGDPELVSLRALQNHGRWRELVREAARKLEVTS